MSDIPLYIGGVLLVLGAGFCLLAGLGLLRLPDLYARMHAASKAGTLGAGLVLLALAIVSGDMLVVLRCLAGIVFLLLTNPVAAHLLARAAYLAQTPAVSKTAVDNLPKSHANDV